MHDKKMPFMAHIAEFRNRLKLSLIVFVLSFFVTYAFSEKILSMVFAHFLDRFVLGRPEILAESVMSGFVTQLNIAFLLSAAISLPVFIYELFMFIEPALNRKHQWAAIKIMLSASILFILGASFVYFIMLPILLEFFYESNSNLGISNSFAAEPFFEFIIMNVFVGGLIFQLPLLLTIANRIGILPKKWLTSSRRLVYVSVLIIAGIITPDHSIISQLLLGGVLIILFEISLLFCR